MMRAKSPPCMPTRWCDASFASGALGGIRRLRRVRVRQHARLGCGIQGYAKHRQLDAVEQVLASQFIGASRLDLALRMFLDRFLRRVQDWSAAIGAGVEFRV